ncbi:MAG: hypothetical protein WC441_04810 [Patescibacteria group bacterium]
MISRRKLLDPEMQDEQVYASFNRNQSPEQMAQVIARKRSMLNPDTSYGEQFGNVYEQYAPPQAFTDYLGQLAARKKSEAEGQYALPKAAAEVKGLEMTPDTQRIAAESPVNVANIVTAPEITKANTLSSEPAMKLRIIEEAQKYADEAAARTKQDAEIFDIQKRAEERGKQTPQEQLTQARIDRLNELKKIPFEQMTPQEYAEYNQLWMGMSPSENLVPQPEFDPNQFQFQPTGETTKKILDRQTAEQILNEAGRDRAKAEEIARQRGYTF